METNAPKRRDNKKSLRVKVISLGNAEVGKVSDHQLILDQTPSWNQADFSSDVKNPSSVELANNIFILNCFKDGC